MQTSKDHYSCENRDKSFIQQGHRTVNKVFILEKNHTRVKSVVSHSISRVILLYTNVFILEKTHSHAKSVVNHSVCKVILLCTNVFILEKNLTHVKSVVNHSVSKVILLYTNVFILEKQPYSCKKCGRSFSELSNLIRYEPADLTCTPPQNDRGWVHFFRIGV